MGGYAEYAAPMGGGGYGANPCGGTGDARDEKFPLEGSGDWMGDVGVDVWC